MGLTFTEGSITTDGTEQNIFGSDVSVSGHHAFYVFMNNMVAGDSITIRVYVRDEEGTTMRRMDTLTFENVQADPAWFYSFLPTDVFRATIQRTAGTDRSYNYRRVEVT